MAEIIIVILGSVLSYAAMALLAPRVAGNHWPFLRTFLVLEGAAVCLVAVVCGISLAAGARMADVVNAGGSCFFASCLGIVAGYARVDRHG